MVFAREGEVEDSIFGEEFRDPVFASSFRDFEGIKSPPCLLIE